MSVFSLAFANPPQKLIAPLGNTKFGANIQSASANANGVFNAIHSSMVSRTLNESSSSLFHPMGFESLHGFLDFRSSFQPVSNTSFLNLLCSHSGNGARLFSTMECLSSPLLFLRELYYIMAIVRPRDQRFTNGWLLKFHMPRCLPKLEALSAAISTRVSLSQKKPLDYSVKRDITSTEDDRHGS
jgi:hypothetical protein